MNKPLILVTGGNGQLGNELKQLASAYSQFEFVFTDIDNLALDNFELVGDFFAKHQPAYCINCAAYTAVDKAESNRDVVMLVNGTVVGNLASICKKYNTKFVHISTDYVFDGESTVPYTEDDIPNPSNVYGESKLLGEQLCLKEDPSSIIIRTAWVYSSFGNNFVKTMMRLMAERTELNLVEDQVGSPTYAADLAKAIMDIVASGKWESGIYHYSNEGRISWYDFAVAIKKQIGNECAVNPIPTSAYPTPAKRPKYSLLNKDKIKTIYGVQVPGWEESLEKCISLLIQKPLN